MKVFVEEYEEKINKCRKRSMGEEVGEEPLEENKENEDVSMSVESKPAKTKGKTIKRKTKAKDADLDDATQSMSALSLVCFILLVLND